MLLCSAAQAFELKIFIECRARIKKQSLWLCNARLAARPALHGRAMRPKTQLFFPLPVPKPHPPSWVGARCWRRLAGAAS